MINQGKYMRNKNKKNLLFIAMLLIVTVYGSSLPVQAVSHYSWGATDCHFDSFISKYSSQFTDEGIVAVIDTGVDATHPFLKGKVLSGYDFIDNDTDASDEAYHGTHVAATIIDCIGDAPVKILPVRAFDEEGSSYIYGENTSSIALGIRYAVEHDADVINLSVRSTENTNIDEAINYAIENGVPVIIGAGNDNGDTSSRYPSHIMTPGAIVVAAGDSNHKKASFSNYGTSVDLMAPGIDIKAAVPGNQYKVCDGMSMATPHVAAAAILLDLAWGKQLTPAELEEQLKLCTTNGSRINDYYGNGFLDMAKAQTPSGSLMTVEDGTYQIEAYCGKVIEVADSKKNDGANIQIWSNADIDCQKFRIEKAGSYYTIKAAHSGKAVDVANGSTVAKANVQQYTPNGTAAQKWLFEDAGIGYVYIRSALGQYMDVYNGNVGNGTNIWAYTFNGSNAQKFKLISLSPTKQVDSPKYYLDINGCFDGENTDNIAGFGTVDVYINGSLVAEKVTDYYAMWPAGTTYEIKNLQAGDGYESQGAVSGTLAGTISDSNVDVRLSFSKKEHVHVLTHFPAREPTCTVNGNIEYWYCIKCGKDFIDSVASREISEAEKTITALGHNYVDGVCTRDGAIDPNYIKPAGIRFNKTLTYRQGQFVDVPAGSWFTNNISEAYELGLMKGSGDTFNPDGSVTLAEAITMAARIHRIYNTGSESFDQSIGTHWYQTYYDYAYNNGIIEVGQFDGNTADSVATRAQFAKILAKSLPKEALTQINTIPDGTIPDIGNDVDYAASVYVLYRAGVLTGSDSQGSFLTSTNIRRLEAASIIARMAVSNNRVKQ